MELKPLSGVTKVLFLGDSITYAGDYVDTLDSWLLRHSRSRHYELINLGLPSETVSGLTEPNHAGGAFPRPDLHERLERALAKVKPDLVVACYGMNDGIYYPFSGERFKKYRDGILWLRERVHVAHARLWLMTPPPFDPVPVQKSLAPAGLAEYPSGHTFEGYDGVLAKYSEWLVAQRGRDWNVIDIHTPINVYLADQRRLNPQFALTGDGVHLNSVGHQLIARQVLRAWGAPEELLPSTEPSHGSAVDSIDSNALFENRVHERQRLMTDAWLTDVGHKRPGMAVGMPLAAAQARADAIENDLRATAPSLPPRLAGTRSDYHGFLRNDFEVDGCKAVVVSPIKVMTGNPWIWRAEFFDHRPELDLALLARGFHLAYIEVGNTFGAPSAMKHWDAMYGALTSQYGLSKKPVLEGLSRGGLYVYNWAAANPTKLSVLYGDNPVCDFKSWPGGKGKGPGSLSDWQKLIHAYGFSSEAEAIAYRKNPVDNLASLARAHVPIIHLAGDADEVVPYEENTVIIKERYTKLGGSMEVMVKHGFHHHPHGLDDPSPLVNFILAHL